MGCERAPHGVGSVSGGPKLQVLSTCIRTAQVLARDRYTDVDMVL